MKKLFFVALLSAGLTSCFDTQTATVSKNTAKAAEQQPVVSVPVFNQDSAFYYVKKQCDFGPRVPNTANHEECLNFLAKELTRLGGSVSLQKADLKGYDGTIYKSTNIIAAFYPERENRVVLFSHWDSRPLSDQEDGTEKTALKKPVMGANDGASGVGVLLEAVRNFAANDPKIGVDIVLFDTEDCGAPRWKQSQVENDWCLGSQYWSKNTGYTAANKPKVGILLDMVGGANPSFCIDAVSGYYAPTFAGDFWKVANGMGFGSFFKNVNGGQIVDDHYYVNTLAGIPTFDVIDFDTERGFPEMWHTQHDDVEHIDRNTLGMVGRVLLRYIYTNCAK